MIVNTSGLWGKVVADTVFTVLALQTCVFTSSIRRREQSETHFSSSNNYNLIGSVYDW